MLWAPRTSHVQGSGDYILPGEGEGWGEAWPVFGCLRPEAPAAQKATLSFSCGFVALVPVNEKLGTAMVAFCARTRPPALGVLRHSSIENVSTCPSWLTHPIQTAPFQTEHL